MYLGLAIVLQIMVVAYGMYSVSGSAVEPVHFYDKRLGFRCVMRTTAWFSYTCIDLLDDRGPRGDIGDSMIGSQLPFRYQQDRPWPQMTPPLHTSAWELRSHAPNGAAVWQEVAVGWPWRSFHACWYTLRFPGLFPDGLTSVPLALGGVKVGGGTGEAHFRVPTLMSPMGLAASSALLWCAFLVPHFLVVVCKRALRRRRGLCPFCAYRTGGLPVGYGCPECGAPVCWPNGLAHEYGEARTERRSTSRASDDAPY